MRIHRTRDIVPYRSIRIVVFINYNSVTSHWHLKSLRLVCYCYNWISPWMISATLCMRFIELWVHYQNFRCDLWERNVHVHVGAFLRSPDIAHAPEVSSLFAKYYSRNLYLHYTGDWFSWSSITGKNVKPMRSTINGTWLKVPRLRVLFCESQLLFRLSAHVRI